MNLEVIFNDLLLKAAKAVSFSTTNIQLDFSSKYSSSTSGQEEDLHVSDITVMRKYPLLWSIDPTTSEEKCNSRKNVNEKMFFFYIMIVMLLCVCLF